MYKQNQRASYPRGYLEESQEPSVVRQWIDGQWVEIEYKPKQKSFTDKRLKEKKKEKRRKRKGKKKKISYGPFYDSAAWKELRKKVLEKYGRQCMKCGVKKGYIQVDHIKPRSKFPELELKFDNMQVLCMPCNMEKSNKNCIDYRGNFAETQIAFEADKHI